MRVRTRMHTVRERGTLDFTEAARQMDNESDTCLFFQIRISGTHPIHEKQVHINLSSTTTTPQHPPPLDNASNLWY